MFISADIIYKAIVIHQDSAMFYIIDLARAKSEALVNNTWKQKI